MREGITHRIAFAVGLGQRERLHRIVDAPDRLGMLPDGRPVVRLDVPLERTAAPGVVAAWGSSTGARASVYADILEPIVEDIMPTTPLTTDAVSPISHVRWPNAIDRENQINAIGYVITERRDPETGEWQVLEEFKLARLSGTPDEQAAAIADALLNTGSG
tara:strand:- start:115 stop:597 length:483 start_codon:yes stop_codon:yes gene_type:complete